MLLPIMMNAQDSNQHFSYTLQTKAPADSIWKIWVDVANWKKWDTGLKDAVLHGEFVVGAKGKLIPDKGPRSSFQITAIEQNRSYTFRTRIPFGWLVITRELSMQGNVTSFTHEVKFTGLLKRPLGASLGKRYRVMLPVAMENIRRMAEE